MASQITGFDLIIRGGMVYDGTGGPPFVEDVGISGDRVAAVGDLSSARAADVIDAAGLAVCPGFIDAHSHDDFHALVSPDVEHNTIQGITTVVVGNCGSGASPFDAANRRWGVLYPLPDDVPPWEGYAGYLAAVDRVRPSLNVAVLVGHGTVREAAMGGVERRAPTDAELQEMRRTVAEGMEAGAVGLSTGLIYEPGRYAQTDEIVALAREAGRAGGVYASHMRNEAAQLLESVRETIHIGEQGGCRTQISHHKASGAGNHGMVDRSLKLIEQARARGLDVTADQYPYTGGSTRLAAVIQNDALGQGTGGLGRLEPEEVLVAAAPDNPDFEGLRLDHFVREWDLPAEEAARRLVREGSDHLFVVVFSMDEGDVRTVMAHPSTMIGTDGIPSGSKPHPRAWATYPRILGRYVRDEGVLSLEAAIHKMTGMPAQKFNLAGRGFVREGAFADLVVFDPETVIDTATYEEPRVPPAGMPHVLVNGQAVVRAGVHSRARAGRALRRGVA